MALFFLRRERVILISLGEMGGGERVLSTLKLEIAFVSKCVLGVGL